MQTCIHGWLPLQHSAKLKLQLVVGKPKCYSHIKISRYSYVMYKYSHNIIQFQCCTHWRIFWFTKNIFLSLGWCLGKNFPVTKLFTPPPPPFKEKISSTRCRFMVRYCWNAKQQNPVDRWRNATCVQRNVHLPFCHSEVVRVRLYTIQVYLTLISQISYQVTQIDSLKSIWTMGRCNKLPKKAQATKDILALVLPRVYQLGLNRWLFSNRDEFQTRVST